MIISILKRELKIFFPSSNLDEVNDAIKELLEKKWFLAGRGKEIEKRIRNSVNKIM